MSNFCLVSFFYNLFINKGEDMAIKLNKSGYDNAVAIIKNGLEVEHDTDWNEDRPTKDEAIRFLDNHDLNEYGLWFLGVDTEVPAKDSSKFIYQYGDFAVLHKSALEDIVKQATKNKNDEVKNAAQKLLNML